MKKTKAIRKTKALKHSKTTHVMNTTDDKHVTKHPGAEHTGEKKPHPREDSDYMHEESLARRK